MISKHLVALLLSASCVEQPPVVVSTRVTTTAAVVEKPSPPPLRITVHAPKETPYRAEILGGKPQNVEIVLANDGDEPQDISNLKIAFAARHGATPFRCDVAEAVPPREPSAIPPHETVALQRQLCALPVPGHYVVDVETTIDGATRVASFDYEVHAGEKNVPRVLPHYPQVFAALGGDLAGVRYTRREWESGAYHVILRVTNASTLPEALGHMNMEFRVTKDRHPLACTDTKAIDLPSRLLPGESALVKIPVTCLVDVKGGYDIHAVLDETELAEIHVEVTSDPLLFLPIWPW